MAGMPIYSKFRSIAETQSAGKPQEMNRLWWEAAPMSYRDWEAEDRESREDSFFDETNRKYLESNPYLESLFQELARSNRLQGKRVLEVGCGFGSAAVLLARCGATVDAIDITDKAVEMTSAQAARFRLPINAVRMDCENLAFDDRTFDYVFSWGVIHHTHRTDKAASEIARVMKSGGTGLLMVYHKTSLRYWLKGLYWLLAKGKILQGYNLDSVQCFFTDGYYHRHFTKRGWRRLLEQAGLTVTRLEATHMAKQYVPGLPAAADRLAKKYWGWLLVSHIEKLDPR